MSGIRFQDCGTEEVRDLQQFLGAMYREGYPLASNEPLLRWQFRDTPAANGGGYHLKIAVRDGRILGCLGYIPVTLLVNGVRVAGAWTANWMVAPGSRRLGVGPLLLRELTQSVEVTAALGLAADARAILPRMGWTDYGSLTRHVAVLDPSATASLTRSGTLTWPRRPRPDLGSPGIAVEQVSRFDERATSLWQRLGSGFAAATERTAEFLNWRYADHPMFIYRLLLAHANGRAVGLAVYRVERVSGSGIGVGRILELLAEAGVAAVLLGKVLDDAQEERLAFVDFFCGAQAHSDALHRWGLLTAADIDVHQVPILLQPVDHGRTDIAFMAHFRTPAPRAALADWYVTKGDGDQDRPN